VAFLITGKSKAEVLKQIISRQEVAARYPASHVWDGSGIADFYLDNQAAALL
jgi:6-phosphogluconolactonase/glucosamine-6-phosphate isomerase/deaminase